MTYLYNLIFYRPILNALVFFYETVGLRDLGIAIILTTLLVRLILAPFFHKGARQQVMLQRLQPKIKKIQEIHKDDKQKQAKVLMDLYKEHGVNPFMSILLIIIQLPILIALYMIIRYDIPATPITGLYSFIPAPGAINYIFIHFLNLANRSLVLVALAALAQYFQARFAVYRNKKGGEPSSAEKMANQIAFISPLVTLFIFYNLPAAVDLYWLVSSLFSIVQQLMVNRHLENLYGNE